MPINNLSFEAGIFACQMVGRIEETEANVWLSNLMTYAQESDHAVVALIDATQTTSITAAARRIIAHAGTILNLNCTAIATHHFLVEQHLQLTLLMAVNKHMYVYKTLAEAKRFAGVRAALLADVEEARA